MRPTFSAFAALFCSALPSAPKSAPKRSDSIAARVGFFGFTLVELLAVIAILSILVAAALPAYNNYSLKSKFSEVVLATAPTKTAISACATTGDCISANAIYLPLTQGIPALSAGSNDGYGFMPFAYFSQRGSAQELLAYQWVQEGAYMPSTGTCAKLVPNYIAAGTYQCLVDAKGNLITYLSNSTYQFEQAYTTPYPQSLYDTQLGLAITAANTASGATGSLADLPCVGGAGCSPATKYVASVSYDESGFIYGTAVSSSNGLRGEQFVLVPSYSSGRVDWAASGSCKTRAGGALC